MIRKYQNHMLQTKPMHREEKTYNDNSHKIPEIHLKGTATLIITMFDMKDLDKPLILKPVSSKSVEKCRSYEYFNTFEWTVFEAAIL